MIKTGKGPKAITSAKSIREAERRAEILQMRLDGHSLQEIGDHMGITAVSVHNVITRALQAMLKEPSEELFRLELARLDLLYVEALKAVRSFAPVLHNGRIVQIPVIDRNGETIKDSNTGHPLTCIAQDRAPVLAGIATAVRISERRAKLLGIDAPIRAQTNLNVANDGSEHDLSKLSLDELKLLQELLRKATASPLPAIQQTKEVAE